MQKYIHHILKKIGEDPNREGLQKTPKRVEEALAFLTNGYKQNARQLLNGAVIEEHIEDMIIIDNIEFYSLCEHHMLPFFGVCHIGYIPKGKVIGLSKIPRIIDMFSHRLQIQERLTSQIAHAIHEAITPHGVAVITEARHLCMMMRGVEKQHAMTKASCMLGTFRSDAKTRIEFLQLIKRK